MASIALLGWGSLLWDKRPEFDDRHAAWESNGPELPLEFSRVSETRGGALTLVIDEANGRRCKVSFTISTRQDPEGAICDLRSREGTTRMNIGFYFADGSRVQSRNNSILEGVASWAKENNLEVVVWTDLMSNFEKIVGKPFSIENAIAHLSGLNSEAKAGAATYVWGAPDFVQTPLRSELEKIPWLRR